MKGGLVEGCMIIRLLFFVGNYIHRLVLIHTHTHTHTHTHRPPSWSMPSALATPGQPQGRGAHTHTHTHTSKPSHQSTTHTPSSDRATHGDTPQCHSTTQTPPQKYKYATTDGCSTANHTVSATHTRGTSLSRTQILKYNTQTCLLNETEKSPSHWQGRGNTSG